MTSALPLDHFIGGNCCLGNSSPSIVLLSPGFAYWRGLLSFADRGRNNTENSNLWVISCQLNWRRVKQQGLPSMVGETVTFHWQLPRALSSAALSWVPHLRPPSPPSQQGAVSSWFANCMGAWGWDASRIDKFAPIQIVWKGK